MRAAFHPWVRSSRGSKVKRTSVPAVARWRPACDGWTLGPGWRGRHHEGGDPRHTPPVVSITTTQRQYHRAWARCTPQSRDTPGRRPQRIRSAPGHRCAIVSSSLISATIDGDGVPILRLARGMGTSDKPPPNGVVLRWLRVGLAAVAPDRDGARRLPGADNIRFPFKGIG